MDITIDIDDPLPQLLDTRRWVPFALSVYFALIMLFTAMMLFTLRQQAEADRLGSSPTS
jgi:hypothetical protein